MKTLNITNGEAFNRYFLSGHGPNAVAFCEAMMDGEAPLDIFSDEFISVRARALNVGREEYEGKMQVCRELKKGEHTRLCLWFGTDTFCQVNLLTLLAYLEQTGFDGEVLLNYIDDESFEIIKRDIRVELGIYYEAYKSVLVLKEHPQELGVLSGRAIELYFDYLSPDGALARAVRDNIDKDDTSLINMLLLTSREYGLSDLQAQGIIKACRMTAQSEKCTL